MPEIKYHLEIDREEAEAILEAFAFVHRSGFDSKADRALCARIVELTTDHPLPLTELRANFHGPNDPGPESQPDALSPYTGTDWKETS